MSQLRILLAEDGADNQIVLRRHLERLGATVSLVDNGKEALERVLAADDDDAPFALVLMDIDMPAMDGFAATRALRARGFTGPIIALTARSSDEDRRACLEAGCDEHVVKPTTLDVLHAVIHRHWRRAPRTSGIIAAVLVSELAGDEEMMEIIRPFVKALPSRAAAIRDALDHEDLPAVKRLAHQLKGSAGGYGFPSITAAAAAIDKAVTAEEKPDKIRRRVDELSQLVALARASVPPPGMQNEVVDGVATVGLEHGRPRVAGLL
jgi:CheY-like chemotaxis protein